MRAVNAWIRVWCSALRDPNEYPKATTDLEFDAIVAPEETVPGAEKINRDRRELGSPR